MVDTVTFVPLKSVLKFETREKLALASRRETHASIAPPVFLPFPPPFFPRFFSPFQKCDTRNNVGGRAPPWEKQKEEEEGRWGIGRGEMFPSLSFLPEFYQLPFPPTSGIRHWQW